MGEFSGYHSTGRAAGLFAEDYGTAPVKLLTIASRQWFESYERMSDIPFLSRSGLLCTSTKQNQTAMIEHFYQNTTRCHNELQLINRQSAQSIFPLLRYDDTLLVGDQFVFDPNAASLDVSAVHNSYLRGCHRANVAVLCNQK